MNLIPLLSGPFPVTTLKQKEVTTDAVTLVWEQQESKSSYSYVVQVSNGSISLNSTALNTTSTITGVIAGSNYNCTVTTQITDGPQAAQSVTVPCFTSMCVYIFSIYIYICRVISKNESVSKQ